MSPVQSVTHVSGRSPAPPAPFSTEKGELRAGPFINRVRRVGMRSSPMASQSYRSSRPDGWTMPRPYRDASLRYMQHGPILPMEEPGFFARLFGWR